jgi:uncharacterized protein (DUF58 family)
VARAASYGTLLDALRGVTWPARRFARGTAAGSHRSRLRGISPEFTEYRPYRQGDDPRRLDWKLFARTDRAYQRITSDRATLATLLIVDASASMDYPSGMLSKWEYACRLAVGLAAVAHAGGDPVGVSVGTNAPLRSLEPRTRRGVVGDVARLLEGVTPVGSEPLGPLLAAARPEWRVALISDFLGDAASLLRLARERVLAGAEVHAMHVVAEAELDPPASAIMARDPETPRLERPLVDSTRADYEETFARWRSDLARDWLLAGATYAQLSTSEPAEHAVRRMTRPSAAGTGIR